MDLGHVSALSIAAMVFTCTISIVLPIALLIICRVKLKAKVSTFFIGAVTFIVFALILEQILHTVVVGAVGLEKLKGNIFVYALYGGTAAAVFEETGRIVAMKFFMKKSMAKENGLMYGIGHGGAEAIIIVGFTYINNILYSLFINMGLMDGLLAPLDEASKQLMLEQLSQLTTLAPSMFVVGGIERLVAITAQIIMSLFVFFGLKNGKKAIVALAFVMHFLIDALTAIVASKISIWLAEAVVLVLVLGFGYYAVKLWKQESAGVEASEEAIGA